MAQYEAGALIFSEKSVLIEPGAVFSSDAPPGRNWIPIDDEARARVAAHFGGALDPVEEEAVQAHPEPPKAAPEVDIPPNWSSLPPLQIFNLGRKLFGTLRPPHGTRPSEYAKTLIAAEEQRRQS